MTNPAMSGTTPIGPHNTSSAPAITPPPRLAKKTLDAIRYVDAGLSAREALQAVNLKSDISREAISKFKEKYKRYSLTRDDLVRPSRTLLKNILRGRAREEAHRKVTSDGQVVDYIDNVYPTFSNQLAVASMVYDRYEPVRSSNEGDASGNTYLDMSSISVQVMVGDRPNLPLDVQAEVINKELIEVK